jgi:hypothetical protein
MKRDELAIFLCGCFNKAKPENLDAVWRCKDKTEQDKWRILSGYVLKRESTILDEIEKPLNEKEISPYSRLRNIRTRIERMRKE